MDTFLKLHFDIESGTIFTACIVDNWLMFVVEIDKETRLETEASRVIRLDASIASKKANLESITNADQEAFKPNDRARKQAKQESITIAEQEAFKAKKAAHNKARWDSVQSKGKV